MFRSRSPLHPALAIFIIFGLIIQDSEAVFLIGKKILSTKLSIKKGLLAKKAVLLKIAILKPIVATALLTKGLALTAIAKPLLLASLVAKPLIIKPLLVGSLVLKAGIGVLLLKKGVLSVKRKVFLAKGALAKKAFFAKKLAIVKVFAVKKAVVKAKVGAVAAAGASAGAAFKKVVIGVASSAKSIGVGAINTGRSLIDVGTSGASALATAAARSIVFLHNLKRPRVILETHHYAVPMPYPIYGDDKHFMVQPEMYASQINLPNTERYPEKPAKSYSGLVQQHPVGGFSLPPPDAGISSGSPYSISIQSAGPVERFPIMPQPAEVFEPSTIVNPQSSNEDYFFFRSAPEGNYAKVALSEPDQNTDPKSLLPPDFESNQAPEYNPSQSPDFEFRQAPEYDPPSTSDFETIPSPDYESGIPQDVEQVVVNPPALTDIMASQDFDHVDNLASEGLKHVDTTSEGIQNIDNLASQGLQHPDDFMMSEGLQHPDQ